MVRHVHGGSYCFSCFARADGHFPRPGDRDKRFPIPAVHGRGQSTAQDLLVPRRRAHNAPRRLRVRELHARRRYAQL